MTSTMLQNQDYSLHLLGWKAFQDLCIAVAEECLRRPVQNFLPNNDAGRDGAFVGRWEGDDPASGDSTIQCKFTSKPQNNLSLSMLTDELDKAALLAKKGLAHDYIILTNHTITGASEIKVKEAFEGVGVGRCRVFSYDWLVRQIKTSPRLRMMAPRLYGLSNLNDLLDERAYKQAQLILNAMGEDLKKLVITEAHRKSVRAISAHNLVLLLGAPAAVKSTIGASLAIGAADIWNSATIKATSPEDIKKHLDASQNPEMPQFFWIDDAWGNTQYQRQNTEAWNQVFPLMQGAIKNGTRFLITSRDYIWAAAKRDLKIQALPILNQSQVIINVHNLSAQEKAQILYNHLKFGDRSFEFRSEVKKFLPEISEQKYFLPESARRFGNEFFSKNLPTNRDSVLKFFEKPEDFLLDTISNLTPECKAAIAVIFLNGGRVSSPIDSSYLEHPSNAFGVQTGDVRKEIELLNGSLLLLVQGETEQYWTYKHPTISDSFAKYVAGSPELVEIYLKGAKPESIVNEVLCVGCSVWGAPVIIPDSMHELLYARIHKLDPYRLVSFLSYRSNQNFSRILLEKKPELLKKLYTFLSPIKEDSDARLIPTLYEQGLLPEEIRENFLKALKEAAVNEADDSFLYDEIAEMLSEEEKFDILEQVESTVIKDVSSHVKRMKENWDTDYSPEDHFEFLQDSIENFVKALSYKKDYQDVIEKAKSEINDAIWDMNEFYQPSSSTSAPTSSSMPQKANLVQLFRDVDE